LAQDELGSGQVNRLAHHKSFYQKTGPCGQPKHFYTDIPTFSRMLECFNKPNKFLSVGRKRMRNFSAPIFFIEQPGLYQTARMFGNCSKIAFQFFGYFVQGYSIATVNQKQNVYPPVIGNPFEMPFQLFTDFDLSHISIIHNIPTFSRMLEYHFPLLRVKHPRI
jgi:hypothetical protein